MELGPRKIIEIGQFYITETVVLLWIISAILILFAFVNKKYAKDSQRLAGRCRMDC